MGIFVVIIISLSTIYVTVSTIHDYIEKKVPPHIRHLFFLLCKVRWHIR